VDISLLSDILASPSFRMCNNSNNQLVIHFIVCLSTILSLDIILLSAILASPSFRKYNSCQFDKQLSDAFAYFVTK
jgi:hypothetical protein